MNRLLPRAIFVVTVLTATTAGYFIWQRHSIDRAWLAIRPSLPPPTGSSAPGLDARLEALAHRFETWPPDAAALHEFASVTHANGQLHAAAAAYRALLQLQPTEARWPHLLAQILLAQNHLAEALPLMRRVTELAPDRVIGWLKLGDTLLKSNATAYAASAYREAMDRDANNRFALLGLARCDVKEKRFTAARSHLQRAIARHPNFGSARDLLAIVFERLGHTAASAAGRTRVQRSSHDDNEPPDDWTDALVFHSHNPDSLLTAAFAAVDNENLPRARQLLQRGLALAPDDPRLHRQLGKTLVLQSDFAGARHALERAIALAPADDTLRSELIRVLHRIGDATALERTVRDGLIASPTSASLHLEAGRIAARQNRLSAATDHLERSWRIDPDQPAAALELADVYFQTHRTTEGIALLDDVTSRFPQEKTALLTLIRQGTLAGHPRTAEWLRRAMDRDTPPAVLAELRDNYVRRFDPPTP